MWVHERVHSSLPWSWDEVQHLLSVLKPLDFRESTSQLHMYQIHCDFFIHEVCCSYLDYVESLDSNYDLKVFSPLCIISILLMICIFFLLW
jgi:hypothetical protein